MQTHAAPLSLKEEALLYTNGPELRTHKSGKSSHHCPTKTPQDTALARGLICSLAVGKAACGRLETPGAGWEVGGRERGGRGRGDRGRGEEEGKGGRSTAAQEGGRAVRQGPDTNITSCSTLETGRSRGQATLGWGADGVMLARLGVAGQQLARVVLLDAPGVGLGGLC